MIYTAIFHNSLEMGERDVFEVQDYSTVVIVSSL